jgi:hypothetical protein
MPVTRRLRTPVREIPGLTDAEGADTHSFRYGPVMERALAKVALAMMDEGVPAGARKVTDICREIVAEFLEGFESDEEAGEYLARRYFARRKDGDG